MKKSDFLALLNAMNIGAGQIEKIAVDTGFLIRKGMVEPADLLPFVASPYMEQLVSTIWRRRLMPKLLFL